MMTKMSGKNVFKSKRNYVYLENNLVYKSITAGDSAALAEAEILRKLYTAAVNAPQVIEAYGGVIIMEYIEGITLTDVIECENISPELLAERISEWFAAFYEVFPSKVRGDVNCRNFILTHDNRVFGVDFEDLPIGKKETDLGRLQAFILNYDPPNTNYKKRLVQALTNCFDARFNIDRALVDLEQSLEIERMKKRRDGDKCGRNESHIII